MLLTCMSLESVTKINSNVLILQWTTVRDIIHKWRKYEHMLKLLLNFTKNHSGNHKPPHPPKNIQVITFCRSLLPQLMSISIRKNSAKISWESFKVNTSADWKKPPTNIYLRFTEITLMILQTFGVEIYWPKRQKGKGLIWKLIFI